MLRKLSIKWKFVLVIVSVSLVSVAVAGVMFFVYEDWSSRSRLEQKLDSMARVIAANSTAALSFDDAKAGRETLQAVAFMPSVEAAALYDEFGQRFAAYARDEHVAQAPARAGADGFEWHDQDVALNRAVLLNQTRIGTIYVRTDLSDLDLRRRVYATVALAIVLATMLLALGLAALLQRGFLAPILGLTDISRRISNEKDYALRAVKQSKDELGFLVDQFNAMLEQIQARDAELEQARAGLEDRVAERTRELETLNRELEAFSYSVAHDLRSPLRSIDGFSQIVLEDYGDKLDEEGKSHLKKVRAATQRMGHLIDDLLNLAKVSRNSLEPEPVDLGAMAEDIAADLRHQHPERKVEFSAQPSMLAVADPNLLEIVLQNLIGNAWKFTGRVAHAKVEVGKETQNGREVYFVRDNGAGFDMAHSKRLFGVFQRLHQITEFPGTGVGLATVKRIVERHGGTVWADASVGKGACFFFTLKN